VIGAVVVIPQLLVGLQVEIGENSYAALGL